ARSGAGNPGHLQARGPHPGLGHGHRRDRRPPPRLLRGPGALRCAHPARPDADRGGGRRRRRIDVRRPAARSRADPGAARARHQEGARAWRRDHRPRLRHRAHAGVDVPPERAGEGRAHPGAAGLHGQSDGLNATEIYCAHPEDFEGEMREMVMTRNCPLHCGDFRLARSPEESRAINDVKGPVLIISASGMATGGRVLHHLKQRLPDPRTTVLVVGYQAIGTRGRRLQNGEESLRIFGEEIPVRATIETIHGLSAHADADGLLRWLRTATSPPKQVFVVHGDPEPARAFAARVGSELGWPTTIPAYRDRVTIDGGERR
ncbi:MAG: hypothetical protein HYS77_07005, partial [Candidatus Rokubacteria bacterium]|nr:hypothetical protein [Candidatus Rokubacteria bacterium]